MSSAKTTPTRVRFAPSPTGHLHVGSIRSGLFNWLWARHTSGVFVLRIEDTDQARLVEGAIDQINDSLEALGIAPDEGPRQGGKFGPYLQSERLDIYKKYSDELLEKGVLYRCWCTSERLAELRTAAQKTGVAFKYDRHCLAPDNQKSPDEPHVLRFRIPETPAIIAWEDDVRGHMEFKITELDDFVALKSDGFPTYHLANVIDDHLMEITHVLRADEWLPSTPKHLLLFSAFGWQQPKYAHLPPVQGPDGRKKLSKRDGAQSVGEYIDEGYLPEALMSFLASLGWNDGTTQEVYTPTELIEKFTLDRIQKSPAQFDKDRLTWINGKLIREIPLTELLHHCEIFWPDEAKNYDEKYKKAVLALVQDRLKYLSELPELTIFFFKDAPVNPQLWETHKQLKSLSGPELKELLSNSRAALATSDFSVADLTERLNRLLEQTGQKPAVLFSLIRIATTQAPFSPGLAETLSVLGKEESLRRIDTMIAFFA